MPVDLQTTFVIKTFERPKSLFTLLKSIEEFYPKVPIIIIDDSQKPIKKKWVSQIQYVHTEFDVGVSEGRNRALKLVKTKYFVLLDDDFEFTQQTKIETFKELLEKYNFDLIGGKLYNYGWYDLRFEGFLTIYRKFLYICTYEDLNYIYDAVRVDFMLNFFLAKTDVIQKNLWDSELKIGEHTSFFLDLKDNHVKVGYTPLVSINHWPDYGEVLNGKIINKFSANHWQDHGEILKGKIINKLYYNHRVGRIDYYVNLFYKKRGLPKVRQLHCNHLPFFLSLPFINKNTNFYQRCYLFFVQFITTRFFYFNVFIKPIIKAFIKNIRYKCLTKICKILSIDYNRLKKNYLKLTMKPVKD